MPEQGETPQNRHARYLRYAAEARELAARTTDSVREHHLKLALAWEAKAWDLVPHLPETKPKLLLLVGGANGGGARLALGHRTDAVRVRLLANGITPIRRPEGAQDYEVFACRLDSPPR